MLYFSLDNNLFITSHINFTEPDAPKSKSFLKIIFIESGTGIFFLNDKKHTYKNRDILMVPAYGNYSIEEYQETCLSTYAFLDPFSAENKLTDCLNWFNRIDTQQHLPHVFDRKKSEAKYDHRLIWNMYESIKKEYQKKRLFHSNLISAMAIICLRTAVRNLRKTSKSQPTHEDATFINDLINYIESHVHEPANVRVTALAKTFNMPKSSLSHFFKKNTGKSIYHYVLMNRLDRTKKKLENTDFTVAQIANQLGFTDESHLTRMFKKYFKTTPRAYREED